jgi:hypothetical protein
MAISPVTDSLPVPSTRDPFLITTSKSDIFITTVKVCTQHNGVGKILLLAYTSLLQRLMDLNQRNLGLWTKIILGSK